jgi:hypothetical protein
MKLMPSRPVFFINISRLSVNRTRLAAGWLVWVGASLLCCAQEPAARPSRVVAVVKDSRFDTPEETIRHFRTAVRHRRWRDEYECYTDRLKARFTYFAVICTREMSDSDDLAAKVDIVFQKFHIPNGLLERFPSMATLRMVHIPNGLLDRFPSTATSYTVKRDERQIELDQKAYERELQRRLEIWEREVYPLDVDWAGLIDELQPLYFQNVDRHKNEVHPSQSGLVCHLSYHTFDRVWNLKTENDRSEGTIVARVRDADAIVQQEDASEITKTRTSWKSRIPDWRNVVSIDAWQGRSPRAPERISLVRLNRSWKIDAVPCR